MVQCYLYFQQIKKYLEWNIIHNGILSSSSFSFTNFCWLKATWNFFADFFFENFQFRFYIACIQIIVSSVVWVITDLDKKLAGLRFVWRVMVLITIWSIFSWVSSV